MRLDDTSQDGDLSIELAPLIDVLFLLVLFFAVSSSLISPEDLAALRQRLAALTADRTELSAQVEHQSLRIAELERSLAAETQAAARHAERIVILDAELKAARDDLSAARARTMTLQQTLTTEQEQAAALQARLTETQAALARAEARHDAAVEELARLRAAQQSAATEASALAIELEKARQQIARLSAENARFQTLFDEDQARIQSTIEAQRRLNENLENLIQDETLGVERVDDRLVLQLSDKILFDSGSDQLKPEGLEVLASVGRVLKERVQDLSIQIAGHTDNVPLGGGGRFTNNWLLSAARAVNVVRFFEDEIGIDPSRLSAIGHGEHQPIASNDTPEGRAINRRIEIVLVAR